MKTKLAFWVGWLLLVASPPGQLLSSPAIVSTGDSHLELLFEISRIEEVVGDEGQWSGVRVPGFVSVCDESAGFSAPAKAYLVAVPVDANVTYHVSDVTSYTIEHYAISHLADGPGDEMADIPDRVAEIMADGYFRDQRVIALRIAPLVYDRQAGVVRVYTRLKVTIDFGDERAPQRSAPPAVTSLDDRSEAAYRTGILNYEQGRMWRRRPVRRLQEGDYFTDAPNSMWIKIRVESTGVYCVTGRDLAGIGAAIGGIDPGTIRLYNGGGLPLSESLADRNPVWMRSVPVKIVDGGDGSFGSADSILFYGLGMRDWADLYDKDRANDVYYKSFFSTSNCYWLTWGGTFSEEPGRMETVMMPGCDGCSAYVPESFYERVHMEKDVFVNFGVRADDGWYWRHLRIDSPTFFTLDTPFPDTDRKAVVKARIADWFSFEAGSGCANAFYRLILELNGRPAIADTTWRASSSNLRVVDVRAETTRLTATQTQSLRMEAPSDLLPPYEEESVCDQLYVAWLEFYYWRKFTAVGNRIFFPAPDSTCTVEYAIGGFTSPSVYVFDVTDQFDIRELLGAEDTTGEGFTSYAFTVRDTISKGMPRRYAVVAPGALRKPAAMSQAAIADIRNGPGAPYCVVTHEDLLDAATTISDFHDGEVVTTEQIFDEFGWGVPDVTAIRDFLRWRYESGSLSWVLLLGDATWDYKSYIQNAPYPNYVPSYERRYLPPFGNPYNTDDWFAYLAPVRNDSIADYPTVGISRLPAASPEEAELLVAKQLNYASNPECGLWQNRVILVADDDHVNQGCEQNSPHVGNVEELSDEAYPRVFDHVKIYLTEYPMDTGGVKPKARADFVKHLNRGALITNFVGHGDQFRWTQEEVFNPASVDLVETGRRETFLIAASCNVSKFDEPQSSSVAENLLRRPGGGTIGSLASTHLAFPLPNQIMNLNVIQQLFPTGDKDPTVPIADAVALAKWLTIASASDRRTYWMNNEVYALFGDPMLELATPLLDVVFETTVPETLSRKSVYEFQASIHDQGGIVGWSGVQANICVREAEDTTGYQSCNPLVFFDYALPGLEVFRGRSDVQSGVFDSRFFMSASARQGSAATVKCFATDGIVSASGMLDSLVVSGEGFSDDDEGPEIELIYNGETVAPVDTLSVGARVDIRLSDESGVAIKGKSEFIPSVSIAYDDVERVNLAESVHAVDGDFTVSEAAFVVPPLAVGEHKLSVSAFDNLNNLTTDDYSIYVGSPVSGAANTVYAYPNPAHEDCYIIWEYENDNSIEVEISAKIYTVSGREIWAGIVSGPHSHFQLRWDGTDMAGDAVANGAYLAVVEATAPSEPGFSTRDTIVLVLIR
ncbi:MAG: C25 family cysteine peptidase [Candidatus Eisenbacteria bacterium]